MRKNFCFKSLVFIVLALTGLMVFVRCEKSGGGDDGTVDVSEVLFSLPTQIEAERPDW